MINSVEKLESNGWEYEWGGKWKHQSSIVSLAEMEGGTFSVDLILPSDFYHITEVFPEELDDLFRILRTDKE